MLKVCMILVLLSVGCVFLIHNFDLLYQVVLTLFHHTSQVTAKIFANSAQALLIAKVLLLVGIPLLVGFGSQLLYSAVTKQQFPYLQQAIWVSWIVMLTTLMSLPFVTGSEQITTHKVSENSYHVSHHYQN